jgi:hypothetical protein
LVFTPSTRLGPYEIPVQIGVGGIGEVYKAQDTRLNRGVAIKGRTTSGPLLVLALLLATACSGSGNPTTPSTSTPQILKGTVTDPAGDALSVPAETLISPDLVSATIEVTGGNLTLTVSFDSGTYSQADTLTNVFLDTDENVSTGSPGVPAVGGTKDADLIGWDYAIEIPSPRGSSQASVRLSVGPSQPTQFGAVTGTATISYPAADQLRLTIPLSAIGNDDGRLKFKVLCWQYLLNPTPGRGVTTTVLDYMPNLGDPPGVVR